MSTTILRSLSLLYKEIRVEDNGDIEGQSVIVTVRHMAMSNIFRPVRFLFVPSVLLLLHTEPRGKLYVGAQEHSQVQAFYLESVWKQEEGSRHVSRSPPHWKRLPM